MIHLDRWYHLIILAWLYTGRLSQEEYVLPRCFFHYVNIYHSVDEDHDLPELKKAVTEVLARYQTDATEGNGDYDGQQFLFLVYGYKGGVDRQLRRRMVEPYVGFHVQRLTDWTREQINITAASVEEVAKLIADKLVWKGKDASLGEHVRRLLAIGELAMDGEEQDDVAKTTKRIEDMVID